MINLLESENSFIKQIKMSDCYDCDYKYICGGECQVEFSIGSKKNEIMCLFKQHLILLAIHLVTEIKLNYKKAYEMLYNFSIEINKRQRMDNELNDFLNKNLSLSFVDGKRIYDKQRHKY